MAAKSSGQSNEIADPVELIRGLAGELDEALESIVRNRLDAFEESITRQERLAWQLETLFLSRRGKSPSANLVEGASRDPLQANEILEARMRLKQHCEVYQIVLQKARHSAGLMLSLYGSQTGKVKEASGTRSNQRTWSSQM